MSMDREQETFVSRRAIIASSAMALITPLVAAAPISAALAALSSEAELVRLDARREALWAEMDGLIDNAETGGSYVPGRLDALCDEWTAVIDQIGAIETETLEGMRIKVRALRQYAGNCMISTDEDTIEGRLLCQVFGFLMSGRV